MEPEKSVYLTPEEVVHKWFDEVWHKGDESAVDRLFADDGIAHGLVDADGNELVGPEGFKPLVRQLRGALHNLEIIVEDVIATEDKAATRLRIKGIHNGDTLGIRATGRAVEFTGMTFIRVKEGKMIEAWNNVDFAAMTEQLTRNLEEPETPCL
ncbi:MAG: ester cyclase [Armatimonas sp.]